MYPTFASPGRQPPDAPPHRFGRLPSSVLGFPLLRVWVSLLRSGLAATPGRITFVHLRTDDSPPVALHLASQQRRCLRLQTGERMLGGDLHPSNRVHARAHWPRILEPGGHDLLPPNVYSSAKTRARHHRLPPLPARREWPPDQSTIQNPQSAIVNRLTPPKGAAVGRPQPSPLSTPAAASAN